MKKLFFLLACLVAMPAFALDRTETDVITAQEYAQGLTVTGRTFALDADHRRYTCLISRLNWALLPGTNIVRMQAFVSYDGEETWTAVGGATVGGGELVNSRTGLVVLNSSFAGNLRTERNGFQRQMRVEFETLATLQLDADCELRDDPDS